LQGIDFLGFTFYTTEDRQGRFTVKSKRALPVLWDSSQLPCDPTVSPGALAPLEERVGAAKSKGLPELAEVPQNPEEISSAETVDHAT
jgi:hypothetical protein